MTSSIGSQVASTDAASASSNHSNMLNHQTSSADAPLTDKSGIAGVLRSCQRCHGDFYAKGDEIYCSFCR